LLMRFMARQDGHQGTLMYDSGQRGRSKCYFEKVQRGQTCGTTGQRRVRKQSYDSLWHYYSERHSDLSDITPNTPAVWVGFKGIARPQPVAADRVWARVMNDNLPESLRDVDKIEPDERRRAILEFWDTLGPEPLSELSPGLEEDFWRPDEGRVWRVTMPVLKFGHGATIGPPRDEAPTRRAGALKEHFRTRQELLEREGCFYIPPTVPRTIVCPHPQGVAQAARRLADDVAARLKTWTKKTFDVVTQPYSTLDEGIEKVKHFKEADFALFILNRQPSAYHKVEWELDKCKKHVKRVTEFNLSRHFRHLNEGKRFKGRFDAEKGRQSWDSFVAMTTLDVFCQMGGVPYCSSDVGVYEAQLVIDVSHDRRYFGVSLLIARADKAQPFGIFADVQPKLDPKCEAINAKVLEDAIVQLVRAWLSRHAAPLISLLVVRDGQICGDEQGAIDRAVQRLVDLDKLTPNVRVDTVELHKDTLKVLRAWQVLPDGSVANVEECTVVKITSDLCILSTTGRATLRQGTADPVVIVSKGRCSQLRDATDSLGSSAQLNWASPTVAQKLPLPVKRLDEDLISRAAQDIKHLR
jgi:hypothetical protein